MTIGKTIVIGWGSSLRARRSSLIKPVTRGVTRPTFSRSLLGVLFLALGLAGRGTAADSVTPPPVVREFRGAWIATVGNIDWPSKPGLSTDQQKQELLALLNKAVELRLNAIIFQVRPGCDALYASKIEPWSEYLTGQMGQAPEPGYDPLAFAVTEAHRRGLELHAWFNPFRARHVGAKSPVSSKHVSRTHPDLVRKYGPFLWLDPGEKAARDYSQSVVLDVVRRYDIDGVHIDDYFYPYREKDGKGHEIDFPDWPSWKKYRASGGKLARDDWRRENVNQFVQNLYHTIKAEKSWVKFGISPFGIWRPGFPAQVRGLDQYDQLYADARKWLVNGWCDYFSPQLYWNIASKEQSFPALLKWWADQNKQDRHLWPGLNSAKLSTWGADEIVNQIALTRAQPGSDGVIHWGLRDLQRNTAGISPALLGSVYREPALVPASPWLGRAAPGKPVVALGRSGQTSLVTWQRSAGDAPWLWLVQQRAGGRWTTEILPSDCSSSVLRGTANSLPEVVSVTAVSRLGNLGPAGVLSIKN